jgi:hypothetical protein
MFAFHDSACFYAIRHHHMARPGLRASVREDFARTLEDYGKRQDTYAKRQDVESIRIDHKRQ